MKTLLEENFNSSGLKVALPTKSGFDFVSINDIIYMESSGNYSIVATVNGNRSNVYKPLKYFDDMLKDHGFARIHHEYLINTRHLLKYNKIDGGVVEMSNGKILEVSRGKKRDFLKTIKEL